MARVALRLPLASGVKLTETGHGEAGFRVTAEQWSARTAKAVTSPPLSATPRTRRGALPVLATVTVRADAEVPTGWGSKATAPGLSPRSCAGRLTGATCPARRAPLPPFDRARADDGRARVASSR